MTRYSVGGGRYRPELNLDEEEDDDSNSPVAVEERRPLKGIEHLPILIPLDPLQTAANDDAQTTKRRSMTTGRSGTLRGKDTEEEAEEEEEEEKEVEKEEEEAAEKEVDVSTGVASNSRALVRPRVEFVGLSDQDDDSQLTDDGEKREPVQGEAEEGEAGSGRGGGGGKRRSRMTARVGRASVAAGTALAEAAAGHRVTMGDGRLRHPRLSLLGKPLNYHAHRRDARFRQMTKIQTTVYNFLERPKDWREISYHLLV